MQQIILASQSPRRKQILELADFKVEVMVSDADESYDQSLEFEEIPVLIAQKKAMVILNKINTSSKPIIAADTIVVCNNKILGKPLDRNDAINILEQLSNNTHQVITGVVIIFENKTITFFDKTHVSFHPITQQQIEYYVDKYNPYDKAGAYAIQEWIGAVAIKKIDGDFYNVMGLPINKVVREIEANKKSL